ncbi:hypothetical protein HDA40_005650 [Hamadaea flava]|uniref:DUF397 domain-containing protein n=1 Tax=Hamadaea flava TaxID=1742688 RepID=A0ABV8LSW5_9ACTN|nr:DUF397 domain-containing protein [Hamadaea flava]MCP2327143.1 hypothetical protein [Hamadaea flava]
MNDQISTDPTLAGAVWRKSARSSPSGDNCVEIAFVPAGVAVRDSKNPGGGALLFTEQEWAAFVAGTKAGEFDL